ncbi:MAG: YkvI family membrane protein [Bacillota bacterium]
MDNIKDPTQKKGISTFKIAATYIGTIVGAGFASGQELLQFFVYFGAWGIAGLAVATLLFIIFGYMMLELGRRLGAKSHLPVINHAGGRWVGTAVDGVITFFLFGAVAVMLAGSGAIFVQEFNLPAWLGSLAMLVATALTVLLGIGGVISAISYVVPALLVTVLAVSIATVAANPGALLANLSWALPGRAAAAYWPLAALLYASYNLVIGVAVLAPMGALATPQRIRSGAILGGLGLGLGAMAIVVALLASAPAAIRFEVPMLFIAQNIAPAFRLGYSIVLLSEVYTTAVGSLYGFAARVTDPGKPLFRWITIGSSVVAMFASRFGFSNLVGFLFPLVGYAGLLLLASLAYTFGRKFLPAGWRLPVGNPAFKRGIDGLDPEKKETEDQSLFIHRVKGDDG